MIHENELKQTMDTKGYLRGKAVVQKKFVPSFPADYTVCVFCWAQISSFEEDLHEGFWEFESDSWICPKCLDRYADLFCWDIKFFDSGIELPLFDDNYLDD